MSYTNNQFHTSQVLATNEAPRVVRKASNCVFFAAMALYVSTLIPSHPVQKLSNMAIATGVFSCGQHYHKKNCLDLSVVDFGIGIAEKVRTLTENEKFSSGEALSWALAYGNSTVRDVSRGLGLNFLQEFIQCNKGTLRIFSNDGYVKIEDNKVIYKKQKINFSGTLINITIRCDESYYCLDSEIWDTDSISF